MQNPHLNAGDWECDLCGATFDSVNELEDHKRNFHERPSRHAREENRDVQRDIGAAGLPGAPE